MSYATMGANAIFNILERNDVVMIAEGLNVFNIQIPDSLVGESLISSSIRPKTGCSVLGIKQNGKQFINPSPEMTMQQGSELVLIGSAEAERLFMEKFMDGEQ